MPSPADAKTILLEHRRGLDALVRQPTNWPLSNDMCTGSMSAWVLAECMSAWVLAECCVSEYVYTVSICVLAMRDEKRWPADAERWGGPRYYYSRYKSPVILVLVLEVVALLLRLLLVQLESYIEVKRWRNSHLIWPTILRASVQLVEGRVSWCVINIVVVVVVIQISNSYVIDSELRHEWKMGNPTLLPDMQGRVLQLRKGRLNAPLYQ